MVFSNNQVQRGDALDSLQEDNPSPASLLRRLALEDHLEHQLREPDELEAARQPLVLRIPVGPGAREARMERGGDKRTVLGVRGDDAREEGIMVQAQ